MVPSTCTINLLFCNTMYILINNSFAFLCLWAIKYTCVHTWRHMYSHSKPHTWNEEPDIGNGYTNVYYTETVVHGLLCVSVCSRLTGDRHISKHNSRKQAERYYSHMWPSLHKPTVHHKSKFFIMGKISTETIGLTWIIKMQHHRQNITALNWMY